LTMKQCSPSAANNNKKASEYAAKSPNGKTVAEGDPLFQFMINRDKNQRWFHTFHWLVAFEREKHTEHGGRDQSGYPIPCTQMFASGEAINSAARDSTLSKAEKVVELEADPSLKVIKDSFMHKASMAQRMELYQKSRKSFADKSRDKAKKGGGAMSCKESYCKNINDRQLFYEHGGMNSKRIPFTLSECLAGCGNAFPVGCEEPKRVWSGEIRKFTDAFKSKQGDDPDMVKTKKQFVTDRQADRKEKHNCVDATSGLTGNLAAGLKNTLANEQTKINVKAKIKDGFKKTFTKK